LAGNTERCPCERFQKLLLLSGLLGHAFVIMTSDPSGQRGSRNAGDVYADGTDGVQVPFLFLCAAQSLALFCLLLVLYGLNM